jgi:hypothetical protein
VPVSPGFETNQRAGSRDSSADRETRLKNRAADGLAVRR